MAVRIRVICDMYVMILATVMAALIFHGAQCESRAKRRSQLHARVEPAVAFQQTNSRPVASDQTNNEDGKRNSPLVLKLSEAPACAADVSRICGKITGQNNFAVIDCLQTDLLVSRIAVLRAQVF